MGRKLLTLDDLYNFYSNQNKSCNFSVEDCDDTIIVHVNETLTFKEADEYDPSAYLTPVHLQSCHLFGNRNKSYISEKSMRQAIPSFYNRPILGYIHQLEDGSYDFAGHEMYVNEDDEIVYVETPVGVIPESCNAKLLYDENKDKTYLEVDGYIFDGYSKAAEILKRKKTCKVSVELAVDELSYSSEDKTMHIDKFHFTGVTILGKDVNTEAEVQEGMLGSNITLADFSAENNSQFSHNDKLVESIERLNEILSSFNIDNFTRKEVHTVEENKSFEESVEVTDVNEVIETEEIFEVEETTEEETNATTEEMSEDNAEATTVEEAETFETEETEAVEETPSDVGFEEETEDEEITEIEKCKTRKKCDEEESEEDIIIEVEEIIEVEKCGDDDKKKCEEDTTIEVEKCGDKDKEKYSIEYTMGNISFEQSLDDIQYAIAKLVNETYGEADNTFYSTIVYGESKNVVMVDCWTGAAYKQSYKVRGGVYSLTGDRVAVHSCWLTADEEVELDNMRKNYSVIEDKLNKYEVEPEKMEILNSEDYAAVRGCEEFINLQNVETHFDMSIDDVKSKADSILLNYAKSGKLNFSVENKVETKKPMSFAFGGFGHKDTNFLDGLLKK